MVPVPVMTGPGGGVVVVESLFFVQDTKAEEMKRKDKIIVNDQRIVLIRIGLK
jgi:hypothetical protein